MNGTVEMESGLKLIRPSPLARSHFRAVASTRLAEGIPMELSIPRPKSNCLRYDEGQTHGQNLDTRWGKMLQIHTIGNIVISEMLEELLWIISIIISELLGGE